MKNFVKELLDYYQSLFDGDVILHSKNEIVTDRGLARYEDLQIKMALQIVEVFKNKWISVTNRQHQWLEIELREHLSFTSDEAELRTIHDILHWLAMYKRCRYCKITKSLYEFGNNTATLVREASQRYLWVILPGIQEV